MEFCGNSGFQISQFFFEKKKHDVAQFFDKFSYPYNKTIQRF